MACPESRSLSYASSVYRSDTTALKHPRLLLILLSRGVLPTGSSGYFGNDTINRILNHDRTVVRITFIELTISGRWQGNPRHHSIKLPCLLHSLLVGELNGAVRIMNHPPPDERCGAPTTFLEDDIPLEVLLSTRNEQYLLSYHR